MPRTMDDPATPAGPNATAAAGEPRAGRIGLPLGILLFVGVLLAPMPEGISVAAQRTAAVAALMAVWWMTEALPLPATSLLPLVLFPALDILSPTDAATPYANPVIFLFMGGFLLALAMQRWGLHRRIALTIVGLIGTGPRRLVLGFMVATAVPSAWVSNTATAAMMLPIGIAIAELLRPDDSEAPFPFGIVLMLGIAYGATIGGVATLIGTPPNAILAAAADELLGTEVGFFEWMRVGVPLAAVMLPLGWAALVFGPYRPRPLPGDADAVLRAERSSLGPLRPGETITMAVFGLTVLGWLFREPKTIGPLELPGLETVMPGLHDATIAMAGALLLFILPVDRRGRTFVLDWETARGLPWGVLLLFGGGLSLARAFEVSGLTAAIAQLVGGLGALPPLLLIGSICLVFLLLTELTSNTATASLGMPVLAAAAAGLGQDPLVFMAAGALACSAAFMMPVATPPNAIAFGSGYVRIGEMIRAGVRLNAIALVLMTVAAYVLVGAVLT
ncbi:MAG: SLC13 family permease [Gemmatimonadota bacterium]